MSHRRLFSLRRNRTGQNETGHFVGANNQLTQRRQETASDLESAEEIRIVLVGKTGNGKSASGNTLLNREAFDSALSPVSVTFECGKAKGTVNGRRIAVIDTPGIYDTKYKECEVVRKIKTCISLAAPGPHAFLIVIKLDRFTAEEQRTVELLQLVFGDRAKDYSMVLFTYGDQLGNTTIEDFTRRSPELTNLIQTCGGRFHVFNNRERHCSHVQQLLEKIERMVMTNGGRYYNNEMLEEAERAIQEEVDRLMKASAEKKHQEEEALRIKLQGEELQKNLKNLEQQFKVKARENAETKNKFIFPGMVVTAAEVGLAVGVAASSACGPLGMGLGAVVSGMVGATLGLVAPAAVVTIKNHCITQ